MPSKFYEYFKENMDGLGMISPETLFTSSTVALATAHAIVSTIDKFGPRVTVLEVIGATTQLELLAAAGGLAAAAYAGAVIGSIAVAAGRSLSGGTSLADVMQLASAHGLNRGWLMSILASNTRIYRPEQPGRKAYAHRALAH